MRLIMIIIGLIFSSIYLYAQVNPLYIEPTTEEADRLKFIINQEVHDTIYLMAYRDLSMYYLESDTDSCIHYAEKLLQLSKKNKFKLWEADAYDLIACGYSNQGAFAKSLYAFNEGIKIVENNESSKNVWNVSHFTNSNNPEHARLCILATLYIDLAVLYNRLENYDKLLEVLYRGIEASNNIEDFTIMSQGYLSLAQFYLQNDQPDSALIYYQTSIDLSNKANYFKYQSVKYLFTGEIYFKKEILEKAYENFLNGLQSAKEQRNIASIGISYIYLSDYYNELGQLDSSYYYAIKGLRTIETVGQLPRLIRAYNNLVKVYKNLDKPDSALYYQSLVITGKDSLYSQEKIKQFLNIDFEEHLRLKELEKKSLQTKSRIRIFSLLFGMFLFLLIALFLYRNNRQKQLSNKILKETLNNLKSAQSLLIQSEKMASLGELTAGIAHEIQNPLNFVNNFSEVSKELLDEMKEELAVGTEASVQSAVEIADDIKQNLEKINHHGKRADAIVKGMLQHSRTSTGQKEPTDINALCDEYLRLAYHGLKARDQSFEASFRFEPDNTLPKINVVPQDIGRVLLNLINNAFQAVNERKTTEGANYRPEVKVSTKHIFPPAGLPAGTARRSMGAEVSVMDNGGGIQDDIQDKIFQPFFTTKPTGQGTGLGLSLSYDIVKAHGGELKVESKEGEGATFTILLLPL